MTIIKDGYRTILVWFSNSIFAKTNMLDGESGLSITQTKDVILNNRN